MVILWSVMLIVGLLAMWRGMDHWADRREMARLSGLSQRRDDRFDPAMVQGLPPASQRFFNFAIDPGTPLATVARIEMAGTFGMGDRARHRYMKMRARQVLAFPAGFVWAMRGGAGIMRLSGSDSHRWTRFWMQGLVPVARMGGGADHARAAFGRYVAEAVFWCPAAVLPSAGITWEDAGPDIARVVVRHDGMEQAVEIEVAADGQPRKIWFQRWSDANPEKRYQLQPFGGYLSDFREVQGQHVPFHVEAGNFFESDAYFAFYIVDVTAIAFV